ncbi:dTDP-4-dehydrorhamnose 3,5-epimerase [Runella rosea]|uniref:dTDP-4-dehydrorhamnose 3,5-epimerase n=1 Tax=Runella rosea TaxID=2259595 RepID=A0A344TCQ4_9BACT|nr:dTDP-4-dehydrorhamnose 3,5-epimerase [Runella rosea]AXE16425.1 dTDP-4-dehydrorhamnose 3,5-epimerase [Runella rosea]
MIFEETPLKNSYVISLQSFSDNRGWFTRTFCKKDFEKIGHSEEWVQLNHSFTVTKGAIRGMHFQYPPHSEIKMVRCISGGVLDVIVDIRKGSPTFLQHFSIELSAINKKMLYIPKGFAHGFQTLSDNCELIYHHTMYYEKNSEGALRYDEPLLSIKWPLEPTDISERDLNHQYLTRSFEGIDLILS